MKTALVGYTGFVGSNLTQSYSFDHLYNSKNIKDAYDTKPDLLIYAGVRAEKFLANREPEKDLKVIEEAFENINKINPKKLVLISTIDVYKTPVYVNEDTPIDLHQLHPYGRNRYALELKVRAMYEDALIVRLPALFGDNIKKNFIYDYIHVIPSQLRADKFHELLQKDTSIEQFYTLQDNGFYKCRPLKREETVELKEHFKRLGFTALNFTDSRNTYQFYNLRYLWRHIETALNNRIGLFNLATEPIGAAELYEFLCNREFKNEVVSTPVSYNMTTKFSTDFGGQEGYIFSKQQVLEEIKEFVEKQLIDCFM